MTEANTTPDVEAALAAGEAEIASWVTLSATRQSKIAQMRRRSVAIQREMKDLKLEPLGQWGPELKRLANAPIKDLSPRGDDSALKFLDEVEATLAVKRPTWKSAADLMTQTFADINYTIPKYLAEGCTLLAGRPKIGKSWLTEDMALAVAAGTEVLGEKVEQGDVLLLALEDNERRLQDRFKRILGPFVKAPKALTYATEWPRVNEGGLEKIEAWIASVKKPRLIVIDVLARVRKTEQGRQPQYDADYQAIAGLQSIASKHRVAIVIVHHLKKGPAENGDAIDKISGTLGLGGAADSFIVLDRDGQGVNLYTRGRDIEEISVAIKFEPGRCRWTVIGQAGEVRKSDERRLILDALNDSPSGMTRADIVATTGMKSNNVGVLLNKMMKAGEIMKTVGGGYLTTPGNTITAVTPITACQQITPLPQCPIPPPPY
jgi:AAA domain